MTLLEEALEKAKKLESKAVVIALYDFDNDLYNELLPHAVMGFDLPVEDCVAYFYDNIRIYIQPGKKCYPMSNKKYQIFVEV